MKKKVLVVISREILILKGNIDILFYIFVLNIFAAILPRFLISHETGYPFFSIIILDTILTILISSFIISVVLWSVDISTKIEYLFIPSGSFLVFYIVRSLLHGLILSFYSFVNFELVSLFLGEEIFFNRNLSIFPYFVLLNLMISFFNNLWYMVNIRSQFLHREFLLLFIISLLLVLPVVVISVISILSILEQKAPPSISIVISQLVFYLGTIIYFFSSRVSNKKL